MVLSNKKPKLFHVMGDTPTQVGRADFILASTSASSSVSHVALLLKLPGHVRKLCSVGLFQPGADHGGIGFASYEVG